MFFEISVTAVAQHYKILGEVGPSVAHISIGNTKAALNQRTHLHANGATGMLKFMGGNSVGAALAVGPQVFLDYGSSTTGTEVYHKSVQTEPTNIV